MPRTARVKSCTAIFHIMVRSISDIKLFKEDDDKNKYLGLIKRYQEQFGFKVYAYCLMTNHGHFIIDANGADISKIMHCINQCYAQYFNNKYDRRGHVFQDRFKSKVVYDERYLIVLSAYIHNNAADIAECRDAIEKYKYSTLGVYLGVREDIFNIIDEAFIMQLFSSNRTKARERYLELVNRCDEKVIKDNVEFKDEKSEYKSERTIVSRNCCPDELMEYISAYVGIEKERIRIKYGRDSSASKALYIVLLRCYCNYTHRDICKLIGDITEAQISKLCNKGLNIITGEEKYKDIIKNFIKWKAA